MLAALRVIGQIGIQSFAGGMPDGELLGNSFLFYRTRLIFGSDRIGQYANSNIRSPAPFKLITISLRRR